MKRLDQVRTQLRARHYAYSTEKSYCHWIKRFIIFHKKQHPRHLMADDVAEFLSHLAKHGKVSASTQNQALCGILFLYRNVLGIELGDIGGFNFSKTPKRLPTVLSKAEVLLLFSHLRGIHRTIAYLLYGAGLRQNETLSLRVMDINFDRKEILIRNAKGNKDRITVLPLNAIDGLKLAIDKSRQLFDQDIENDLHSRT